MQEIAYFSMNMAILEAELKEHTKQVYTYTNAYNGDKTGNFRLCLMGDTGAEVIARLTGRKHNMIIGAFM